MAVLPAPGSAPQEPTSAAHAVLKLLIVGALFGLMVSLPSLNTPPAAEIDPRVIITFGFIALAAYVVGGLFARLGLPQLTAYLFTGALLGEEVGRLVGLPPSLILVSDAVEARLEVFNTLALALVGMMAGGALDLALLRERARRYAGLLVGQMTFVLVGLVGGVVGVSRLNLGVSMPMLDGLPLDAVLAAALLLGAVGVTLSPAVSLGVTRETRAAGPVAEASLAVSVLNNVVSVAIFAVAVAVARGLVAGDEGGAGEGLAGTLALTLGGAVVLGVVVAAGLAAWCRVVGSLVMLVVAGLCFVTTVVAARLGVDPLVTFLIAGFLVRNATAAYEPLKRALETLSLPVWVVLFVSIGAKLHLESLLPLWPAALGLFVLRALASFGGAAFGAAMGEGPPTLWRVGWLGLLPQAGLGVGMVATIGADPALGQLGEDVAALATALVAVNVILGPILFKLGLGLAGELPRAQLPAEESRASLPRDAELSEETWEGLPEWLPEPGHHHGGDAWGTLHEGLPRRLAELGRSLRADLQGLVRDLRSGVIAQRRDEAHRFFAQLRREFLRQHRRALVRSREDGLKREAFLVELRAQPAQLAQTWENHILERAAAADFSEESKKLTELVAVVDRLAEGAPPAAEVPLDPALLAPQDDDTRGARLRKGWLRARRALGFGPMTRVVELRAIARTTLSGEVPLQLHELAGMLVLSERHMLARARNIFESYQRAVESLAAQRDLSPENFADKLEALREEVEAEFTLAQREVDRLADETVRVAANALGRPFRSFTQMISVAGTPALPESAVRYSRVFQAREDALSAVRVGFDSASELARGEAGALAMELQLVRLRTSVRALADDKADHIARDMRGRLVGPYRRVRAALTTSVEDLFAALALHEEGLPPAALSARLRDAVEPLSRAVEESLSLLTSLRNSLRTQSTVEPLRAALWRGVDGLTDHFVVAWRAPGVVGRRLPPAPTLREVPFRDLAAQVLDGEVGRGLGALLESLGERVDDATRLAEELQRGLAFNTELSLAEIEVLPAAPTPQATRLMVKELLVGTLQRMSSRAAQLDVAIEASEGDAANKVREIVLGAFDELQAMLLEGRYDVAQARMGRVGSLPRQLLRARPTELLSLGRDAKDGLRELVGEERWTLAREWIGLPTARAPVSPDAASFAAPAPRVELPMAIRRLFSDSALEAGDLLIGREGEVDAARRVLLGQNPGASRAVAVLGLGGVGQGAVVNTLLRGVSDQHRVIRIELDEPVTTAQAVDALLSRVSGDCVVVVEGLEWLFSLEPGGFAPLRRFVERVVEDRGRNAWLISAERPVWGYADRVVALHDAFPERVTLSTLDAENMRRALLIRHGMSGYNLRFARVGNDLGARVRGFFRPEVKAEALAEERFFERLHQASGGMLGDALRLWMASVVDVSVDRNDVVMGEVPPTPIQAIRALPDDVQMTLRQVARLGRVSARSHALQFRREEPDSEAFLNRLAHWGLLERRRSGDYVFSPGLAGPLYRALRERRLVA
ncbi:cation:proton antiporter [Myxococcota bacterium]|nr:cation:proton antiporter [Myxococcota bacterium]